MRSIIRRASNHRSLLVAALLAAGALVTLGLAGAGGVELATAAEVAPKMAEGTPKMAEGTPKMAERTPKMAERTPKIVDDAEGEGNKLVARLQALRPGIPIERVARTPIPDIYALEITGGTVYYGTGDGRYLFAGDLYRLNDDDLVNLAEAGRAELRRTLLAEVPREDMVIFSPSGPTKAAINVFTDVDCGYCQKLHLEVPELNRMGVEVRYLAYPRAGIGSRSYQKIVSAWCAEDPQTALTRLKAQQPVPDATCPNPVAHQYELGRELGVTGTPAIILADGTLLPGYMPAADLANAAGI